MEVRSPTAEYWQGQTIVRPLSRGIVPVTHGRISNFLVKTPGQFSVERPGVKGFHDEALFLFTNAPDATPAPSPGPNTIVLSPGIHQHNVDLKSGQTLDLAPGSVLFGSINIWNSENVRIAGRGTVVYCGPQALSFDTGWIHRRAWHPLTTHQVKRLSINGVTFISRSRTWTIQLWNTTESRLENIKIISARRQHQPGWHRLLWRGDIVVRDSFFRIADDSFALLNSTSLPVFILADLREKLWTSQLSAVFCGLPSPDRSDAHDPQGPSSARVKRECCGSGPLYSPAVWSGWGMYSL